MSHRLNENRITTSKKQLFERYVLCYVHALQIAVLFYIAIFSCKKNMCNRMFLKLYHLLRIVIRGFVAWLQQNVISMKAML